MGSTIFRLIAALTFLGAGAAGTAGAPWQEPVDVAFTARCDNTPQRYVLMLPQDLDAAAPVDLVVALHGHGSDRWQFVRSDRDECRALRDAAARYGMIYVSPDYRATTSWMGPKAEADVLQILDEVEAKYPIRHTLVCGASMGGTSALTFAALHPDRVDGVVAINGTANHVEYENYQDAIAESFGGTKTEVPEEYQRRSAELRADGLTMPMAATVGGRDKSVPPDSVRRLFGKLEAQGRPVLLVDRPDGGHATNYYDTMAAACFVMEKVRGDGSPPVGYHIRRTMSLLASATPEHRTPVRILLYGQSIVRQDYIRKLLAPELARRYPNAELTIENRAIGGYTAPALQHTAVHDLYPFYPDLVIFHVYGGERGEFEGILRGIREKTTAEILTWPHHVDRGGPHRTPAIEAGSELRRQLARKYDCELVELRRAWKSYLKENDLEPGDLLVDVVHLNRRGGELMARLVADHFVEPENPPKSWAPTVQSFDARDVRDEAGQLRFPGEPWRRQGSALIGGSPENPLVLHFRGNRVVATTHRTPGSLGTAKVLVDGKPVSSYPQCYAATLPTPTPIDYRPALKLVELGDDPKVEDWTLTAHVDSDDGREFHFTVVGSVTGNDGQGDHTKPFVSKSGRLKIEPRMFSFAEAVRIRKKPLPESFDVHWKVYLMGVDVWKPKCREEPGAVDETTLVQGVTNEPHVLTIIPNGDGPVPLAALTVHRPPLNGQADGSTASQGR